MINRTPIKDIEKANYIICKLTEKLKESDLKRGQMRSYIDEKQAQIKRLKHQIKRMESAIFRKNNEIKALKKSNEK